MATQTLNKFLITPAPPVDLSVLPERLRNKLLPFQTEGVNFAISKDGRCLIADEMGLGKTLQAISTAYYYKNEWPLLIILPASLKYQWVEELEKWLPELLPTDINIINSSSDVGNINKCKINVVAYSLLRFGNPNTSVLLKAIKAQQFKILICDESHNIKNKNTRTTNVVLDIVQSSKRCVMLSGTPALNKPVELFTQIDSLSPGRFGTFNDYTKRFCDAKYIYIGRKKIWDVNGARNLDELEYKLKQYLMIRRLKKDVLKQLPPKRRQKVPFDLKFGADSQELQNELAAMQEELERLMTSSGASMAELVTATQAGAHIPTHVEIRRLITKLYTKTCEAKVGPVVEFVMFYTSSNDDSSKILVFAHHHTMLNSIQEALWKANVKHIRIDGSVPSTERNLLVRQFQTDPQTKVAVLSILAAGSGLTLTAASIVLFAELYWTPAILMQCEDRAHRIGQMANAVNIYYLVAKGTIDERVWSMVEKKTRVLAMALDGQKRGLSAAQGSKHVSDILSAADVKRILTHEQDLQIDVDIDDYFKLAELKCQNQPTIQDFIRNSQVAPSSRKRPKKLKMDPVQIHTDMNRVNSDEDEELIIIDKRKKRKTMTNEEFMNWALNQSAAKSRPQSASSEQSLPSLGDPDSGRSDDTVAICSESESSDISEVQSDIVQTNEQVEVKNEAETPDISTSATPEAPAKNESFTRLRSKRRSSAKLNEKVSKQIAANVEAGTPTFNIIPGTQTDDVIGSDISGDLFSDCSSFDEGLIEELDSPKKKPFTKVPEDPVMLSQTEKDKEARLAAQLFAEDSDDDGDIMVTMWRCSCGTENNREWECCRSCALPQLPTTWTCGQCQTLNKLSATCCDECLTDRDSSTKDQSEEAERVVDISKIPKHELFYYLISQHTGRIFLHDKDKKYLEASFHSTDIENPDLLPDVLLKPENYNMAKEFVTKWNALKKREQKALTKKGQLIDCPERAHYGGRLSKLKSKTNQRYKTKEDIASEADNFCKAQPGAQTRVIKRQSKKESESVTADESALFSSAVHNAGYIQVMSSNNKPLCIECHKEYTTDLLSESFINQEENGWQTRFCSPECADAFWLKRNTAYIRQTAKSLDAGVCEQCEVNAQELYRRIKHTRSLKERAQLLQSSRYNTLSAQVKASMCKEPTEGQFWHVDHVLPVYAGGGQCGIENLRTLCTPCHQIVTAAQAGHRAKMRAAIGCQTISDFFSPQTKVKLKQYDG